jgi:hypothetical protein
VAAKDGERGLRLTFRKPSGGNGPEDGEVLPLFVADASTPYNLVSREVFPSSDSSRNIVEGSILITATVIPEISTWVFFIFGLLLSAASMLPIKIGKRLAEWLSGADVVRPKRIGRPLHGHINIERHRT